MKVWCVRVHSGCLHIKSVCIFCVCVCRMCKRALCVCVCVCVCVWAGVWRVCSEQMPHDLIRSFKVFFSKTKWNQESKKYIMSASTLTTVTVTFQLCVCVCVCDEPEQETFETETKKQTLNLNPVDLECRPERWSLRDLLSVVPLVF